MANWNPANFVQGTDWPAQATINQFYLAFHERIAAVGAQQFNWWNGRQPQAISEGDDVQAASMFSNWQFAVEMLCEYFVASKKRNGDGTYTDITDFEGFDPEPAVEGGAWVYHTPDMWAFDYNRQAPPSPIPANIVDAALGGHGWTRKYTKEFLNDTATAYTDGNAFAVGDKARRLSDLNVCSWNGTAWTVVDQNHATDTPPDTVTAYGRMQAGDYIGPWIFNDLMATINLLKWTFTGGTWVADSVNHVAGTLRSHVGDGIAQPDEATARSTAESDWAANSDYNDVVPNEPYWGPKVYAYDNNFDGPWYAALKRRWGWQEGQVTNPNLDWAIVPHVDDFYAVMVKPDLIGFDDSTTIFDGPTGFTQNLWHKYETQASHSDQPIGTVVIGQSTSPPAWPTADNTAKDFQVVGAFVVTKWAFQFHG